MQWFAAACTWLVGTVLIASGTLKIGTATAFRMSLTRFGLPQFIHRDERFARAFPFVEIGLGLGTVLVPAPWHQIFTVASLALYVGFLVLVVRVVRRKQAVSCNCFGGIGDDSVDRRTIARNSALVLLAVIAVVLHDSPASVLGDRSAWLYAVPAVVSCALAVGLVIYRGLRDRRRKARQVRSLTVTDADGSPMLISEFQDPPTYLVFFSAFCGSCSALVEEFRWWPHVTNGGFDVQPVFMGPPTDYLEHPAFAEVAPYAWFDVDRSVSLAMAVSATPGAVLVDAEHPLGKKMSLGAYQVRELVVDQTKVDVAVAESGSDALTTDAAGADARASDARDGDVTDGDATDKDAQGTASAMAATDDASPEQVVRSTT
ncbi:TlpA family protein disulfide reductase [Rudaeicoccus suwonensis]|uniref:Methylamine utilization protein MauE n=1 Tax=Rudaeicoccus suwonensis TaxID=657409 RepID=A0A561EC98_9MICO|nr:MauE/DoxX family redox-associated membrane protein [Rudaeicoccus suwonensis]TWE13238.1 methylamine utilization protein MauE [Rudaeicoccus suwonensis]